MPNWYLTGIIKALVIGGIGLLVVALSSCQSTMPYPLKSIKLMESPPGYVAMVNSSQRGADLRSLKFVLNTARSIFKYKTDRNKYNQREHWAWPTESFKDGKLEGDCEDFALFIHGMLRGIGIRSRLVRVIIIKRSRFHIVVEAGGYILDNEYSNLMTKDNLNYKWISISSYNLKQWYSLHNDDAGEN